MTILKYFLASVLVFFSIEILVGQDGTYIRDSVKARDIAREGVELAKAGKLEKAIERYEESFEIGQRLSNQIIMFLALEKKAIIYKEMGRYQSAEKLFLESVERRISNNGVDNVWLIATYTSLGEIASRATKYKKALEYYQEAQRIAQFNDSEGDVITMYLNMGIVYYFKRDFETALKYFKKYELFYLEQGEVDQLASVYNNSGALYRELGDIEESIEYMLKSIEILENAKEEKDWAAIARGYSNAAILYTEVNQPYRALEMLDISNNILEKYYPTSLSLQYNNNTDALVLIYGKLGKYERMVSEMEKTIAYHKKVGTEDINQLGLSYVNLGGAYEKAGQYELAITTLQKGLMIVRGKSPEAEARFLHNLSSLYSYHGDKQKAIECSKQALQLWYSLSQPNNNDIADIYAHLSIIYNTLNNRDSTLHFFNQSVNILTRGEEKDLGKIISTKSYTDIGRLRSCLYQMAVIFLEWYQENGDESYLLRAEQHIDWIQQLTSIMLYETESTSDKKYLLDVTKDFSALVIQLNQLKLEKAPAEEIHKERILGAMENSKSVLLQGILKDRISQKIGQVPDSVLAKKQTITNNIKILESKLISDETSVQGYENNENREKLAKQRNVLEQLNREIEVAYPKYTLLNSKTSLVTLRDIRQKLLNDQTALIEYLVTDSTTYQVVVTEKKTLILDLELPKGQLDEMVDSFRKSLSDYQFINQSNEEANQLYLKSGYELYQVLLEKGLSQLEGISELIIIPDYTLGHIPFEALLTKPPSSMVNYKVLDYLLYDYQIRYAYSAQLLYQYQKSNVQERGALKVLGMASSYDPVTSSGMLQRTFTQQRIRKHLIPLPSVQEEVSVIQEIVPSGDFYKGIQATEASFKENANQYNVLHLAMHGILNTEYPMASAMAFTENNDSLEDNFLYGYEIAQMDLNADLVVLSACETGYGKFEQGEGVMSLARSFMYAGIPSTVVSLWQVNDASTSVLMQLFYKNLNEGASKSRALAMAKRDYLQRAQGIAAHPAYWAAFICIGDDTALVHKGGNWYWWLGGVGILIFLVVLGLKKRSFLSNE